MEIVIAAWFAAVVLALLVVVVQFRRDRRRRERAELAEWQAVIQAAMADDVEPGRLEVQINDWGSDHGSQRWRYTVWDPDFDYSSSRVEGGLVPYAVGNEARRVDAVSAALRSIKEWARQAEWSGTVTIVDDDQVTVVESSRL